MRKSSDWDDMSEYLVHFTKPENSRSDYDNMMSIYGSRKLIPGGVFGLARESAPAPKTQETVCFSEIPLHQLDRLSDRRSSLGIGFKKEFIIGNGGAPVWYLEKGCPTLGAVFDLIASAKRAVHPYMDPVWSLTPFIDAPGEYPGGSYRFDWEREWRHVGTLDFLETDVAFLIIPEELHSAARGFFNSAYSDNTGPAYFCPFIDAKWKRERIIEVMPA